MPFKILATRLRVGNRTTTYPKPGASVPAGAKQDIALDAARCDACGACAPVCPTGALAAGGADRAGGVSQSSPSAGGELSARGSARRVSAERARESTTFTVDHGACIACGACVDACPPGALALSETFENAARSRDDLTEVVRFAGDPFQERATPPLDEMRERLRRDIARVFGRSLHIREVAAGGCNGCEVEAVNLSAPYYDVERLGVHFVASPRHADMLLVTGPTSWHMADPLKVAYEAMPDPRVVVAVGACGIMGGVFAGSYAVTNGVANVLPVDVYVPGCPPRPEALIHGILLAIGRAEQKIHHRDHSAAPGAHA
ncbi:MAG: NADH-quinone oxidoreductase subunit NuoB [Thermoplasmatota archaeon]